MSETPNIKQSVTITHTYFNPSHYTIKGHDCSPDEIIFFVCVVEFVSGLSAGGETNINSALVKVIIGKGRNVWYNKVETCGITR